MGSAGLLKAFGHGLASLLGKGKTKRISPHTQERMRFEEDVRKQFVELKKKGINIPIFTL